MMDQMPLASAAGSGEAEPVVVVVAEQPLYRCSICLEEETREKMIHACHCARCVRVSPSDVLSVCTCARA